MSTTNDTARTPFSRGWHRIGEHSWAWLEPDGGWGKANAGLVSDQGHGLQVDTLFDLGHARHMRDSLALAMPGVGIETVVNTHADPDHCTAGETSCSPRRPALSRSTPRGRWPTATGPPRIGSCWPTTGTRCCGSISAT